MTNAHISSTSCPSEFEPRCSGQSPGTNIEGVWLGLWRSEGFLASKEEMRDTIARLLGSGLKLASLAGLHRDIGGIIGGPAYFAIAAVPGTNASTQVYEFQLESGHWRFFALIHDGTQSNEWLSGDCTECYEYWERWGGD